MLTKRQNLERQALARFEQVASEHGCCVSKGQGLSNRILGDEGTYFQFGDLRVETDSRHIVVEVESAGGVTNLVKYWYCLQHRPDMISKPVVLLHVFRQTSQADYRSHLLLRDFLYAHMLKTVGDKFTAKRFTYRTLEELGPAVEDFRRLLIEGDA